MRFFGLPIKGCKTKGIFICEWRKRKDGCPLKLLFKPKKIYFAGICQLRGICSESRFTGVKLDEVGIKNKNSLVSLEQILNMSLITETTTTTTPMKDDYDFVLFLLLFAMNQGISLRECIICCISPSWSPRLSIHNIAKSLIIPHTTEKKRK